MRTVLITFLVILSSAAYGQFMPSKELFSYQKDIAFIDDLIYSVAEDNDGYWWIGTSGGLVRYDGTNSQRILSRVGEPLAGLKVNRLIVDGHFLWLGFLSGGVAKLNLINYQLSFYREQSRNRPSPDLLGTLVVDMAIDESGVLWVGTESGLNKYLAESDSFASYKIDLPSDSSIYSVGIRMAMEDRFGRVWVATMKHGLRFLSREGVFQASKGKLKISDDLLQQINAPGNLRFIKEDAGGDVLLLLKNRFLKFNQSGRLLANIEFATASFVGQRALGMALDSLGDVWVRTESGGVFKVKADFSTYQYYEVLDPEGKPKSSLQTDLFVADSGDLVIANLNLGLDFISSAYLNEFKIVKNVITSSDSRETSSSYSGVFLEGGRDFTFIYDGNEYKIFNHKGNLEETIRVPVSAKHTTVAWGMFWLCNEDGLFSFNPNSDKLEKLGSGYFGFTSFSEKEGLFIVGEDGIYLLSKPEGQLKPVGVPEGFEPITVTLYPSRDGSFWLISDGIPSYFEKATMSFIKPMGWRNIDDLDTGNDGFIESGYYYNIGHRVSKSKLLWQGDNWWLMPPEIIQEDNRLGDVAKVYSSDTGLWFITQKGSKLGYLDYKYNTVNYFDARQGFPRKIGTALISVSKSNQLTFLDGADMYKLRLPSIAKPRQNRVLVTGIRVGNHNEESQAYSYNPSSIFLSPEEQSLHIEFSNFKSRENKEFFARYRLIGVNDKWVETFSDVVSYAALDSGLYHFEVQAIDGTSLVDDIQIVIASPWWRSWWAYAVYFTVCFSIVLAFTYQNLTRLRLKRQKEAEISIYSQGFESIDQGVSIVSSTGVLISKNRAFNYLFGNSKYGVLTTINDMANSVASRELLLRGWEILCKIGHWSGKIEMLEGNKALYIDVRGFSIKDSADGKFMLLVTDVSDSIRNENKLQALSTSDDLTGLPNRRYLLQELKARIDHIAKNGGKFSLHFLDVDRFKNINDSFGHFFGDQCLRLLSIRLKNSLMEGEFIARLGGDEFVVISAISPFHNARSLEEKILEQVVEPLIVDGKPLYVSLSVGCVVCPEQAASSSALMRMADLAMYCSKERGGNQATHFVEDMNEKPLRKVSLENELRMAINSQQLEVHFQPKVDLAAGRVCGFEALIRWRTEERGLTYPGGFIEVAEETGIIIEMGWQVLDLVCMQLDAWRKSGLTLLPVAVNVSAKQLAQPNFAEKLHSRLMKRDIETRYIEIEVTETAFASDIEYVIEQLAILSERGHVISIDDYGTGYSSLSYISRLPVDSIKIDQSFVGGIVDDENKFNIVKNTIALAASLQLKIVAEGVDSNAAHGKLLDLACDIGQGFFYSPALPGQDRELVKMLLQPNIILANKNKPDINQALAD